MIVWPVLYLIKGNARQKRHCRRLAVNPDVAVRYWARNKKQDYYNYTRNKCRWGRAGSWTLGNVRKRSAPEATRTVNAGDQYSVLQFVRSRLVVCWTVRSPSRLKLYRVLKIGSCRRLWSVCLLLTAVLWNTSVKLTADCCWALLSVQTG